MEKNKEPLKQEFMRVLKTHLGRAVCELINHDYSIEELKGKHPSLKLLQYVQVCTRCISSRLVYKNEGGSIVSVTPIVYMPNDLKIKYYVLSRQN